MKFIRKPVSILFLFVLSLPVISTGARAEASLGNSALTVAFATVGGAVMGASTLPFYDEPGDHAKNIFYGAALGAVVGVLISAYAGVKEGPDYSEDEEEASLFRRKPSELSVNEAPEFRLRSEASAAIKKPPSFGGSILIWSPLASISF